MANRRRKQSEAKNSNKKSKKPLEVGEEVEGAAFQKREHRLGDVEGVETVVVKVILVKREDLYDETAERILRIVEVKKEKKRRKGKGREEVDMGMVIKIDY